MSWVANSQDRRATMGTLPEIGERFAALYDSFWQLPHLPAETLELCRLRLAQLHGSNQDWLEQETNIDPGKKAALKSWASDERFSDAERACLEITEIHAMDARAITDAQADAVKAHFGEVGLVALFQALGVFDGMIRLGLLWQLGDAGED